MHFNNGREGKALLLSEMNTKCEYTYILNIVGKIAVSMAGKQNAMNVHTKKKDLCRR